MKKRRELDALVNNGKMNRRNLPAPRTRKGQHELLRSVDDEDESESSDEVEFSLAAQKESVIRKNRRHCHTHAYVPICAFILVALCLLVCGGLVWFLYELRREVTSLRSEITTVESSNQANPEEFQSIHTDIKDLDNRIQGSKGLVYLNAQVQSILHQLQNLNRTTDDLSKGIAAAKSLQNLPERVKQVTENVARLGSTLNTLQTDVVDLKSFKTKMETEQKRIADSVQQLKNEHDGLSLSTVKPTAEAAFVPKDSDSLSLPPRINILVESVMDMNNSVHHLQTRISILETKVNSTKVESSGLEQINTLIHASMTNFTDEHVTNMTTMFDDRLSRMNKTILDLQTKVLSNKQMVTLLNTSVNTLNGTKGWREDSIQPDIQPSKTAVNETSTNVFTASSLDSGIISTSTAVPEQTDTAEDSGNDSPLPSGIEDINKEGDTSPLRRKRHSAQPGGQTP